MKTMSLNGITVQVTSDEEIARLKLLGYILNNEVILQEAESIQPEKVEKVEEVEETKPVQKEKPKSKRGKS